MYPTPILFATCAHPKRPDSLLTPCPWCKGVKATDGAPCGCCAGGGFAPVCGTLAATKAYPRGRPFRFNPGTGELIVTRKSKQETYTVREFNADEFPDDPPLKGFAFVKHSTGEVYHLLCAPGVVLSCDCGAGSWGASAKCNARAREAGDPTHETAGCVHADFVLLALREGLLPTAPAPR